MKLENTIKQDFLNLQHSHPRVAEACATANLTSYVVATESLLLQQLQKVDYLIYSELEIFVRKLS